MAHDILHIQTQQANHCVAAFQVLQDRICHGLEAIDGTAKFAQDNWERPGGGGGRSRTIAGSLIEKGGVGFSHVYGELSPAAAKSLGTSPGNFVATGVSIVLHPRNPWMPIIHMNVRYFELAGGVWWFGGGIDLTPHYIVPAQAAEFHQQLKLVCDAHPCANHAQFKQQADDYFYIPHREETRGIGGIFYDRLCDAPFADVAEFTLAVGDSFVPIYAQQAHAFRDRGFGESHKAWQQLRRGRYVEFNLVWDRGTKFGLHTNGRTESILMSMPPSSTWEYCHQVKDDSPEAFTQAHLHKGFDWLNT